MNEEMYEEEDDDLPMQYRRINALNPGLAYSAFNERVNSYLAGQIGVRNYLHQAIFQANQNQYANQFLNQSLQSNVNGFPSGTMSPSAMTGPFVGQSPAQWAMPNMSGMQPGQHARSASTPTDRANHAQTQSEQLHSNFDARRMSIPVRTTPSPSAPSPASQSQNKTPHSADPQNPSPALQTARIPAHSPSMPSSSRSDQLYPLTTKLPIEAQQLIDGSTAFSHAVHPSMMTAGVPMPSTAAYNYNPNFAPRKPHGNTPTGLQQTLSPYNMHSQQAVSPPYSEPQSAMSAPATLDFGFNGDMFSDLGGFGDSQYNFDLDFGGTSHNSGQNTPASNGEPWNETDFFNYAAASD